MRSGVKFRGNGSEGVDRGKRNKTLERRERRVRERKETKELERTVRQEEDELIWQLHFTRFFYLRNFNSNCCIIEITRVVAALQKFKCPKKICSVFSFPKTPQQAITQV